MALKNEELIKLLLQKYRLKNKIRNLLPLTVEFDENKLEEMVEKCQTPSFLERLFCCAQSGEKLHKKILSINTQIENMLQQPDFDVSNVFVTFETEEMQRVVLQYMKAPKFRHDLVDEEMKFEGEVLSLTEPDEPSSIRWNDLQSSSLVSFARN